ncbi:MAG: RNA polymerase sigma factor [Melioribacteraceae bacterium]|nr:MAG: RNA polymerase sigma factor [Melioribacteraceae bacterium]
MGKYKDISDSELFDKIKKYDSRALEELYERYGKLLYSLVLHIVKDKEKASELVVDIFALVWKNSEKYDTKLQNPFTWILLLARNKAVDYLKREKYDDIEPGNYNDKYEENFIMPVLDPNIDRLSFTTANEMKDKIERAFGGLTDAQKYVINLSYYEGFTIQQISKKLNIPVETVRNKVMTAMGNLRDNLLKV